MPSRSLYLYWPAGGDIERDEIEDIVEGTLGDDGEVTGAGAGMGIVNLDVEIYDDERSEAVWRRLNSVVAAAGLPSGAYWKWEYSDVAIPVEGQSGPRVM